MLSIKSVRLPDDERIAFVNATSLRPGYAWITDRLAFAETIDQLDLGYLKQGPCIGRSGHLANHAVDNVQVRGEVVINPAYSNCQPASFVRSWRPNMAAAFVNYKASDYALVTREVSTFNVTKSSAMLFYATLYPVTTKDGSTVYGLILAQCSYTLPRGGLPPAYHWDVSWADYNQPRNYRNNCWIRMTAYYPNGRSMATWSVTHYSSSDDLLGGIVYEAPENPQHLAERLAYYASLFIPEAEENGSRLGASKTWTSTATVRTTLGSFSQKKFSATELKKWMRTQIDFYPSLAHFSPDDLSLHARDCLESFNDYGSNLLAYTADLKKVGDTAKEMLRLVGDIKNPKAWASAWLSYRFGDRLFISDTRELLESINKRLTTRFDQTLARAATSKDEYVNGITAHRSRTSTIVAANDSFNGIMTAINNLMRWDAWPTLENTWDMIPLSFVVDWFLPVSDLLGQIDATVQTPYVKVQYAYVGEKLTCQHSLTTKDVCGTWEYSRYRRFSHNALSDIRPFSVEIAPPSFGVTHAGDTLALAFQLGGKRHR